MSKTADRVSTRTILAWGLASAPVALFKTTREDKGSAAEWVKAGPNGKPLYAGLAKGGKRYVEKEPLSAADTGPAGVDFVSDPLALEEGPEDAPEPSAEIVPAVFEEGGDAALAPEQMRRGVLVEGKFVDLTDHIAEIEAKTKLETMEVAGFIRREAIQRFRIKGSYYLGSDGPGGPKVLQLLSYAMRETRRVAVVKLTKRTRQTLGVISPSSINGALIVYELEWAANVLLPGPRCLTFLDAEVTAAEARAAVLLAEAMYDAPEILNEQEDDRVRLERELVEAAEAGNVEQFAVPAETEAPEGASLEELLAATVAAVPSA